MTISLLGVFTFLILTLVPRPIEMKHDSLPHALIVGEDRSPLYIKVRVRGLFKSLGEVARR